MSIPREPVVLMRKIYKDVFPITHVFLAEWKRKAQQIPNDELRTQAIASIETKTFHCEGGSIYGLLANDSIRDSIRFIVAYQTISDYLDNLCDRSTSLDPVDFRALHESMLHALTPGATVVNYYRYREDQDDDGYLHSLVQTCQEVLMKLDHYDRIAPFLFELASYYCDLQVYKHIDHDERVPHLLEWFNQYREQLPENMTWYEFSACAGSTLGIFCLVSYAFQKNLSDAHIVKVRNGLFPYVQGLHILLDYFIDQEEDRLGGDLNFCFYFPSEEILTERLRDYLKQADRYVKGLPDEAFHRLVNRGLLGVYLSDQKTNNQREIKATKRKILNYGGIISWFFYVNGHWYRKLIRKRLEVEAHTLNG